jgi:hypothetical protein
MNLSIIENDTVVNVLVCESIELAHELTAAYEIIDSDENNAFMNYIRKEGVWLPPDLNNLSE